MLLKKVLVAIVPLSILFFLTTSCKKTIQPVFPKPDCTQCKQDATQLLTNTAWECVMITADPQTSFDRPLSDVFELPWTTGDTQAFKSDGSFIIDDLRNRFSSGSWAWNTDKSIELNVRGTTYTLTLIELTESTLKYSLNKVFRDINYKITTSLVKY